MPNSLWKPITEKDKTTELIETISNACKNKDQKQRLLAEYTKLFILYTGTLQGEISGIFKTATGLDGYQLDKKKRKSLADNLYDTLHAHPDLYGPALKVERFNGHECIIVTEQAIHALGLKPEDLKTSPNDSPTSPQGTKPTFVPYLVPDL